MERMGQRIEARGNRNGANGRWFRVGVLSATALAPLIARWSDLRASNRTQVLRELAAARLSDARDARDQAVVRLAPVRAAANARLSDARDLASAQFDNALDRLAQAPMPDMLRNVPPFSLAVKRAEEMRRQRQRQRRRMSMLWLAGVGVGLVAAGAAAYFVARRRMSSAIEDEDEPMVELPVERNLAEAVVGRGSTMGNAYAAMDSQAEVSVPLGAFNPASGTGTANPSQARYIGNIHTMVFHDASDTGHLPAEENRIYFSSEDEARQAGFRFSSEAEDAPKPENPA